MTNKWEIRDVFSNKVLEVYTGTYEGAWQYIQSKYGSTIDYTVNAA